MQAITYQFCTIRNVDMSRVTRANKSLGKRIQLSNFVDVQGADALLDRGKLLGSKYTMLSIFVLYIVFISINLTLTF